MLKIKLSPIGKKHQRYFRISVLEEKSKITGRAISVIGHYYPLQKKMDINLPEYQKWISKGAQPTPQVRSLITK